MPNRIEEISYDLFVNESFLVDHTLIFATILSTRTLTSSLLNFLFMMGMAKYLRGGPFLKAYSAKTLML